MAAFGANYPCFKPASATAGTVVGKLVSANATITLASGDLYADDERAEHVSEFAGGNVAMETDDIKDDVAAVIYGAAVNDGLVTYNKDDSAPVGTLAYYKTLMRSGKKLFKGYCYPKVQAALGNDNAQTKGSSITFQTSSTTFEIMSDDNGDWRKTKEFDTAAEAVEWVNTQCAITAESGA